MNGTQLYHRFLIWRAKNLSNRNFILLIALLVGICGGLAAVVLKSSVHYIQHLLTMGFADEYHNYVFFIYPLIGILLTVTFRAAFRHQHSGHGMASIMLAVSKKSSLIEPDKTYSSIVSAALTVGFGGSVGLEAPIVFTGAAIGSNLGRFFHLGYKKRTLLIGCGVAAGIGGIFNAPIAGLVFCIEVLMLELSVPAFVPLLIAAVSGTIVSRFITGSEILFNSSFTDVFYYREIPVYITLGIFTGLISIFFLRSSNRMGDMIHRIKGNYSRAIWGGLILGLMIFIFPPLYGEGYNTIKALLAGNTHELVNESFFFTSISADWFLLLFVAGMIAIKALASSTTVAAGGMGGNFAPPLFLGGLSGFFMARLINTLGILPFPLSETNFILVGMAGTMSGVMHAPLTAIFLIAEITSGYTLVLPLMIVSAISFATSSYVEPHSVYIKQLAKKGHVLFHDKDRVVLTVLKLKKLIERDFITVNVNGSLRDLVQAVSQSHRNLFPVLDDENKMQGVILLDDIRQLMFRPEKYDTVKIKEIMHPPPDYIRSSETMEEVMAKFDRTGAWNLPVIDADGKYMGLISKSKIFSHYRSMLKKQAREETEIIE